jgi:hypothetical protein
VSCVSSIIQYIRHKLYYCCLIRNDCFRIVSGKTPCNLVDGYLTTHGLPQTVKIAWCYNPEGHNMNLHRRIHQKTSWVYEMIVSCRAVTG